MKRMIRLLVTLVALLHSVPLIFAQEAVKIDSSRLQALYQQYLRDPENAYTTQLIDDERKNIRKRIETELAAYATPFTEETELDEQELTRAVDRQNTLLESLQERMREHKADLDLLVSEEKTLYAGSDPPENADVGPFRLTQTHAELLARKAVLQERVAALEAMNALQQHRLKQLIHEQRLDQFGMLISIGTYAGIIIIILFAERFVRRTVLMRITNIDKRYTVTKLCTFLVYFVTIVWILGVVFSKYPNIIASLAIVGAGLAIALQDIVKDILGWVLIIQNRLFMRGHRITVGDITGEVVDSGPLRTTLLEIGMPKANDSMTTVLERTGKVLSIPNATLISQPLTNHSTTSDFVRAELRITITYESDWRKAQEICKRIIDEVANQYLEADQKQTRYRHKMLYLPHRTGGNQVYYDILADGVELTMRFTVPIGERRPVTSQIADRLLEEIAKSGDVHFAYRTQRILAEMLKP